MQTANLFAMLTCIKISMNTPTSFLSLLIIPIFSIAYGQPELKPDWKFRADRFQVVYPDQTTHIVNLYGVQCLDILIEEDPSAKATELWRQKLELNFDSISKTWKAGFDARNFAFKQLEAGFQVIRPPKGSHPLRSAVRTNSGEDLAEMLVSAGWAKAVKETVDHPDGRSSEMVYQELLKLQSNAQQQGIGIWAGKKNNAKRAIPYEKILRSYDYDIKWAKRQPSSVLDPNTASLLELRMLNGLGPTKAGELINYREKNKKENEPVFSIPEDLLVINGIGDEILEKIQDHLIFPGSKFEVFFNVGHHNIRTSDSETLKRVHQLVKRIGQSNFQIRIIGYASPDGSEEMNQTLSEQRAEEVKNYLINLGVPAEKITEVSGKGEADPMLSNEKSRRVDILIE